MRISKSSYELFLDCPRRYFFRSILHLSSPTGTALRIGSAVHTFLETWYNLQTEDRVKRETMALSEGEKVIHNPPPGTPRISSVDTSLAAQVRKIGTQYAKRYSSDDIVVLQTEKEGEAPLGNGHSVYYRVDGVCTYQGQVWFLEHKTTYTLGEEFLRSLHCMHQLVAYTYAVGVHLKMKMAGALVNIIRKPSKRDPEAAFWREPVVVTRAHIRNMLTSFSYVAEDITQRRKHTEEVALRQYGGNLLVTPPDDWPQLTKSCTRCAFYDICWLGVPAEKWQWRDTSKPDPMVKEEVTASEQQDQVGPEPTQAGDQQGTPGSTGEGLEGQASIPELVENGQQEGAEGSSESLPAAPQTGEETQ